ncbi:WG repeat-containing protein [Butyrivibrio proteoclasticus]|uniref:WG repeat-containing protein n=1 Tax=Butyrivibrio proteoclasticus TaxID=43305 RepID=UPI000479A0A1|nr:WG repeat-containing protein [Butyrivibrio proteoclasticus]
MQEKKIISKVHKFIFVILMFFIINIFLRIFLGRYFGDRGGYVVIDANGREVTGIAYDFITEFNENGIAFVRDYSFSTEDNHDGYAFIDVEGNQLYPGVFDGIESLEIRNNIRRYSYPTYYIDNDVFISSSDNKIYIFSFSEEKLYSAEGGIVEYESIYSEGLIPVKLKGDKYGYLNAHGQLEISNTFSYVHAFQNGIGEVRLDGKEKYIDHDGNYVDEAIALELLSEEKDLSPSRNDDYKYGYVDKNGNTVVDYKYSYAEDFCNGFAVVEENYDKRGYINANGEVIVPCKYSHAYDFSEDGFAVVSKGEREFGNYYEGFVDSDGKELFSPQFYGVKDFSGGYSSVALARGQFIKYNFSKDVKWRIGYTIKAFFLSALLWYYLHRYHLLILFLVYVAIFICWANHTNCHRVQGGYYVINRKGKMYTKREYDVLSKFNNNGLAYGVLYFKKWKDVGKKCGFVRPNGKAVFMKEFSGLGPELLPYELVGDNQKNILMHGGESTALYSFKGKALCVIPDTKCIPEASVYSEGLRALEVISTGLKGYIDDEGRWAIEPKFEDAQPFANGRATVKLNGQMCVIDHDGNVVAEGNNISEEPSSEYHDGLAKIQSPENGMYGFANEAGEVVIPCEFEEVRDFSDGFAAIKQNGSWGFIRTDGTFLIKPYMKDVIDFSNGYGAIWTTDDVDLSFLVEKEKKRTK